MANDSLIRKIPLLGNCDLTNFHADIHDYEGFEKDNALYLNKRKVNWWKKKVDDETVASIQGIIDGDYFKLYKGSNYLGHISRKYYKVENVEATTYLEDSLQSVVNPYPVNNEYNILLPDNTYQPISNVYYNSCTTNDIFYECYVIRDTTETWFIKSNEVLEHFFIKDVISNVTDFNSENTVASFIVFHESYVSNSLLADTPYLFFKKGTSFSQTLTLTAYSDTSGRFSVSQTGDSYYICNENLFNTTGILRDWTDHPSISGISDLDRRQRRSFFPLGKNSICSMHVMGYSGYSSKVYRNTAASNAYIIDNNSSINLAPTSQDSNFTVSSNTVSVTFSYSYNVEQNEDEISYIYNNNSNTTIYINSREKYNTTDNKNVQYTYSYNQNYKQKLGFSHFNYSIKYGKWAVNYIDNVACNIAHDYKKLVQIEGEEDSSGKVLSIDGYNDTYIYYHVGGVYKRISIDMADSLRVVAKDLNGIYIIFNTVSYHNAIYLNSNTFFCSCDDWNDRCIWRSKIENTDTFSSTSRLNDKWNTTADVKDVSDQLITLQRYLPVVDDKTSPSNMILSYIDNNYTCPEFEDENGDMQKQQYTVYFPENVLTSEYQSLVKQGYVDVDGFTIDFDDGDIFAEVETEYQLQITPCLLDSSFMVYETSVVVLNSEGGFELLRNSLLGNYVLIYQNSPVADPLKFGDTIFVINGIPYTYKYESNQILDNTGLWAANTNLLQYIGYTSKVAYFWSKFDKCIYAFQGDNSFQKVISLERYTIQYTTDSNGLAIAQTLYLASIDLLLVNLSSAVLILYEGQYIILETDEINYFSLDINSGNFIINENLYSLIKENLIASNILESDISIIPIQIDTQLYGDPENEKNIINDTVYLTVDNLMSLSKGSVKIQAIALQNQKVIKAEEKTINLKPEDFNELSQCLIKYQPKLQECRGFKLKIKSDFEIADLKIGTSQGAINQTTKRI